MREHGQAQGSWTASSYDFAAAGPLIALLLLVEVCEEFLEAINELSLVQMITLSDLVYRRLHRAYTWFSRLFEARRHLTDQSKGYSIRIIFAITRALWTANRGWLSFTPLSSNFPLISAFSALLIALRKDGQQCMILTPTYQAENSLWRCFPPILINAIFQLYYCKITNLERQ